MQGEHEARVDRRMCGDQLHAAGAHCGVMKSIVSAICKRQRCVDLEYASGTVTSQFYDQQIPLTLFTLQHAADLCTQLSESCYGFRWQTNGLRNISGTVAILKGGQNISGYIDYLLTVGNYLQPSPTSVLFVKSGTLPSSAQIDAALWELAPYDISEAVDSDSGMHHGFSCFCFYCCSTFCDLDVL